MSNYFAGTLLVTVLACTFSCSYGGTWIFRYNDPECKNFDRSYTYFAEWTIQEYEIVEGCNEVLGVAGYSIRVLGDYNYIPCHPSQWQVARSLEYGNNTNTGTLCNIIRSVGWRDGSGMVSYTSPCYTTGYMQTTTVYNRGYFNVCYENGTSPTTARNISSPVVPPPQISCSNPTGTCDWYKECIDNKYTIPFNQEQSCNSIYPLSAQGNTWYTTVNFCTQRMLSTKVVNGEGAAEIMLTLLESHIDCWFNRELYSVGVADLDNIGWELFVIAKQVYDTIGNIEHLLNPASLLKLKSIEEYFWPWLVAGAKRVFDKVGVPIRWLARVPVLPVKWPMDAALLAYDVYDCATDEDCSKFVGNIYENIKSWPAKIRKSIVEAEKEFYRRYFPIYAVPVTGNKRSLANLVVNITVMFMPNTTEYDISELATFLTQTNISVFFPNITTDYSPLEVSICNSLECTNDALRRLEIEFGNRTLVEEQRPVAANISPVQKVSSSTPTQPTLFCAIAVLVTSIWMFCI